ncbi:MAG TPA: TetR/AcrR family transcriptional regulator [Polyangiaceae bacterium]|nr:TetR/AcrR family transcriptional regulator [Polyangiaceae bacterium]
MTKPRLRERFRQETAQEILLSAEQVCVEQGAAGASMALIAERAGVAVGTLYNRFKDRDALLQTLLAQRRAELLEKIDRAAREFAELDLRARLVGVVRTLLLECEQHRPFLRLALASEWGHGPSKELMLQSLRERFELVLKERGAPPLLREDPDGSFPVLLLALIRGTLERDRYGLSELDPAAAAQRVVDFFLKGAGR